ncbi:hypothetical protein KIN20_012597 [Parelaphostrongylus tenuis]|uniref:Uncharacterized protein n=1 Tax=Parelaphostrongylus tenuis TaxID=148309 RepID=A0AAD5MCE2_PARTN|nr:hypothetical protein KIN20_012597 [Parelaphostrongylus tenuis]
MSKALPQVGTPRPYTDDEERETSETCVYGPDVPASDRILRKGCGVLKNVIVALAKHLDTAVAPWLAM